MNAVADPELDTTDPADAALIATLNFMDMAEVALVHGGPSARRVAALVLNWPDSDIADLAEALGIVGVGRTHPRQRLRLARRDAALRRLWRTWRPELGPTAAADVIAQRWRRYDVAGWPRHRDAKAKPAADPEATLHRLMLAGHTPLSAETLRKVLGEKGRFPPVEPTRRTADI